MEIIEVYETIQNLALEFSPKIDYYEALFLNNIICGESLLQSQRIILYMRYNQCENELISNFNSKEELIFLWKYSMEHLKKRNGLIKRIECKKEIKSTPIDTERERFEYAKFLIKERSNQKLRNTFEWNSEVRLYMNTYGSKGMMQNDYFEFNPTEKNSSMYLNFSGKTIIDCYNDMRVIKEMKRFSKTFSDLRHNVEIILFSPQIVSKLLMLPLNQMLNTNNHGKQFEFPQLPQCLTLKDNPHSEKCIHNIYFDMLGNSVKNKIYIDNGSVTGYYGEMISDKAYCGNVLIHRNTLKYSMVFPTIENGTRSIYSIMQSEYMVFDKFVGKIDMWAQRIIGSFFAYDYCHGCWDSVSVNIKYQDFLDSIVEFTQESININRIIACRCPYVIVNKEIINGKYRKTK